MNAQIKMRLITGKYRRYKFIHTTSCTAQTDRSPTYYFSGTVNGLYVEKLGSFVNSINFSRLSERNTLFLLRHVSVGTSGNRRKGVFQQNRSIAVLSRLNSTPSDLWLML